MSLNAGDTRAVEQDRQSDEDLESESDKYWDSDESDEDRESEADAQPQDEDARETGEEGQPDVITIEPGDRIFADFSSTTNDVRPLVPNFECVSLTSENSPIKSRSLKMFKWTPVTH